MPEAFPGWWPRVCTLPGEETRGSFGGCPAGDAQSSPAFPAAAAETCQDMAPPSVGAPLPWAPRITAGQSPRLHPLTPGCLSVTWVPGVQHIPTSASALGTRPPTCRDRQLNAHGGWGTSPRLQPPVAAGRSAGGGAACLGLEAGPPAGAAAPPLGTARQGAQPGARGAVPSWEQHGCWHSPLGLVCPVTTAEVPGCGWMSCDRRPGGPHRELGGRDGHPCTSGCRPGRGQQGG